MYFDLKHAKMLYCFTQPLNQITGFKIMCGKLTCLIFIFQVRKQMLLFCNTLACSKYSCLLSIQSCFRLMTQHFLSIREPNK